MTLPSSGTLSLNQIADEFGLSHATVFPGGFYGLGGAPSSGALSFNDFYGRSAPTAPTNPTVSIAPTSGSAQAKTKSHNFTGAASASQTPSSYSWGVVSINGGGSASVVAGGSSANATLAVTDDGNTTAATFYCDMVVGGTTYRATCTRTYTYNNSGTQ